MDKIEQILEDNPAMKTGYLLRKIELYIGNIRNYSVLFDVATTSLDRQNDILREYNKEDKKKTKQIVIDGLKILLEGKSRYDNVLKTEIKGYSELTAQLDMENPVVKEAKNYLDKEFNQRVDEVQQKINKNFKTRKAELENILNALITN
jgi:hypothetical protein